MRLLNIAGQPLHLSWIQHNLGSMEADSRDLSCSNCYLNICEHHRHAGRRSVGTRQESSGLSCKRSGLRRASISRFTTLFALLCISFGFKLTSSAYEFPLVSSSCLPTVNRSKCQLSMVMLCRSASGNDFMEFDMTGTSKCIMEDISQNVIVVGNYAGLRKADRTPVHMTVKVCVLHRLQ